MSLDERQIEAHFDAAFDITSNQVLILDKINVDVDESKPWCRFSIQPGDKAREENGGDPLYLQLGGIYLQVFIPKTLGISAGDEMIGKFENLFTDWRSPDGALNVKRMTRRLDERDKQYIQVVRFAYESLRKQPR